MTRSGVELVLGPAPWAGAVEAWLEASNAEEIADDIERYTLAQVAQAVAAERERCAKLCEEVHADTGECPEMALHCAARIRGA